MGLVIARMTSACVRGSTPISTAAIEERVDELLARWGQVFGTGSRSLKAGQGISGMGRKTGTTP
jgi:hypothetical protein